MKLEVSSRRYKFSRWAGNLFMHVCWVFLFLLIIHIMMHNMLILHIVQCRFEMSTSLRSSRISPKETVRAVRCLWIVTSTERRCRSSRGSSGSTRITLGLVTATAPPCRKTVGERRRWHESRSCYSCHDNDMNWNYFYVKHLKMCLCSRSGWCTLVSEEDLRFGSVREQSFNVWLWIRCRSSGRYNTSKK